MQYVSGMIRLFHSGKGGIRNPWEEWKRQRAENIARLRITDKEIREYEDKRKAYEIERGKNIERRRGY